MILFSNKKFLRYSMGAVIALVIIFIAGFTYLKKVNLDTSKNFNLKNDTNSINRGTLEVNQIFLGKTDVKGKGISIMLKDSENIDKNLIGIVHNVDVRNVVSSLIDMGAEAIAVNEERIVGNSEIVCDGMDLVINGNKVSHPFVIKAIGDMESFDTAIGSPMYGNIEALKKRGVQVKVDKYDEIIVPKVRKEIKLKYTQIADNNEQEITKKN